MSDDVFGIVGTTQAGVFRVERVVAEGGFAVIYRAFHVGFRAPVALKCLKVPDAMKEAQRATFLDKFREEGELLFRLSALVSTVVRPLHIDVLELSGTIVPFLALEWLDGEGLDAIVAKRRAAGKPPIDIKRLVPFLQPAAQALAQAHQMPGPQGTVVIIHRDIKPENIFVAGSQDGEVVKILDFGIARTKSAAQLDAGEVTSSGALDAFTPGYAAPEQWLPKRYGQVGPWTDVFGLALTMVEVLAGFTPITGDLGAMAEQTTNPARRPTPRTFGVAIPDAVEQAFARALAVDPRERTRSVAAFWTELEAALGLPPSIKVPEGRPSTRSLTGASEPPPPGPGSPNASDPVRALAPTQAAPVSQPFRVGTPASDPRPPPRPPPELTRVRRPDGDLPVPRAEPAEPAPLSFELELDVPGSAAPPAAAPAALPAQPPAAPPSQPAPGPAGAALPPQTAPAPVATGETSRPQPRPIASPPVQLAQQPPRERGTMAPANRQEALIADLREKLRVPAGLIVAAIVITASDSIYTRATGELFTVGSLRPMWITAPLALIGVALAAWRVLAAL